MEIILGNGKYVLTTIEREGVIGVLFQPSDDKRVVDLMVEHDKKEYTPADEDLIIWCKNLEGARVLQDKINYLALKLNRYTGDLSNMLQVID